MGDISAPLAEALRDRYLLERELGHGGMATVYLARDLRHRRPVALKVLAPALATAVGVERFQREIQLAAALQHPHILPVHDSGESAGLLWYTMPYVEGGTLRERLRCEPRLEIEEAVLVAIQVADALECAHGAGIVHRDIKPENILLSRGHALVADFGIARAAEEAGETLTQTGLIIGTPAYMSPEQATGPAHAVDRRSDVYSLGCVLYEMLTGEQPFAGPTPRAIATRRLIEPPPDPRVTRPAVPQPLAAAVMRSMATDPVNRFGTAAEFIVALRSTTVGPTFVAGPSGASPGRLGAFRSRRAAVAAGLILLTGLSAWVVRRAVRDSSLDATLLAVAPFDVLEPALSVWHEGLMDVFSRTLDGAGSMRTVSPTLIARRWHGHADHASAMTLARATRAGTVLYGTVIPAGPDSVRLTAILLDARHEEPSAEFDVRGPRDRLDRLADSLTLAVLRAITPTSGGALAGNPVGTGSHLALRAFLRGEQHYRRSEFDSAQAAFRKAVTLDSGFALAWHGLSRVLFWRDSTEGGPGILDPEIAGAAFRAASARGLSLRDSLVLLGDSLFMAMVESGSTFDDRFWRCHTRLFKTLEEAHRRYPDDPEVVLSLAEAGWQWGGASGRPLDRTLSLYDRAIALDSTFTPSYVHAVFIALAMGDPPRALKYTQAHLRWGPSASVRGVLYLIQALLAASPADSVRAERLLDSLPVYALSKAFGLLAMSADSGEAAVRVERAIARRGVHYAGYGDPAAIGLTLGARGHAREMLQLSRKPPGLLYWVDPAILSVVPEDIVREHRTAWLRATNPDSVHWQLNLRWLALEGDTAVIAHVAALDAKDTKGRDHDLAYLALARRDTADAVARFLSLPDSTMLMYFNSRLTKAQLLRATGHFQEAARTLGPSLSPWGAGYLPQDGLWHLERGRVHEKLGDMAGARCAYQTVIDLWRHADPELQPFVAEARDALIRIGQQMR